MRNGFSVGLVSKGRNPSRQSHLLRENTVIPIILGSAAFLGFIYSKKQSCNVCNSKFTLNEECIFCGKQICGDCSTVLQEERYLGQIIAKGGRCCTEHVDLREEMVAKRKVEEDTYFKNREDCIKNEKKIINAAEKVELFSINYKGKTPSPKLGKSIETLFFKKKQNAEFSLRIAAAKNDCSYVLQTQFDTMEDSEGNYNFTMWRAKGVI